MKAVGAESRCNALVAIMKVLQADWAAITVCRRAVAWLFFAGSLACCVLAALLLCLTMALLLLLLLLLLLRRRR